MDREYPMLRLIERYGGWMAVCVGVLVLAGPFCITVAGGSNWWLLAGVIGGVVVFAGVRSYVELVRVMIDMLLPK